MPPRGYRPDQAPLVLVVVVALFMVPVFICFFQKFPNFCVQICCLSLGIRVRFRFTTFLPSVVQSNGLASPEILGGAKCLILGE